MKTMGEICTEAYKERQLGDFKKYEQRKVARKAIFGIQEALKKFPNAVEGDSDLCPVTHRFAEGIYIREMFIPKGVMIVGKIHKHSHPNFLMSGEVSMLTEDGTERIKGPVSMISKAGTKRVVFAHEDTTWCTIHVTESTDLKEIEEEIIAKDYNDLSIEIKEQLQIEEA